MQDANTSLGVRGSSESGRKIGSPLESEDGQIEEVVATLEGMRAAGMAPMLVVDINKEPAFEAKKLPSVPRGIPRQASLTVDQ